MRRWCMRKISPRALRHAPRSGSNNRSAGCRKRFCRVVFRFRASSRTGARKDASAEEPAVVPGTGFFCASFTWSPIARRIPSASRFQKNSAKWRSRYRTKRLARVAVDLFGSARRATTAGQQSPGWTRPCSTAVSTHSRARCRTAPAEAVAKARMRFRCECRTLPTNPVSSCCGARATVSAASSSSSSSSSSPRSSSRRGSVSGGPADPPIPAAASTLSRSSFKNAHNPLSTSTVTRSLALWRHRRMTSSLSTTRVW
mmetsp:Transcript_28217/g.78925  ORF Transcript_28217/g.78925 Transcript_28217/m.78925 type:complete len:257 (-) Transcript_28217:681-1451(-)